MRKGRSMLVCVGRAASAPKKHLVYAVRACKLGPRFVVMEPRCACAIGEFYLRRAKLAKNVDFWRLMLCARGFIEINCCENSREGSP